MKKVITYGTYDLLHFGHIKLLKRAKTLGDYLIVAVTADDFDKNRGKINVQQSLMQRIEAVRDTGLADEIIVEEYEGQKIDDIKRYDIDIFTIGSDWKGKFDYLKEYCTVMYLDRTEGISSSELRGKVRSVKLALYGNNQAIEKYKNELKFVNGIEYVEGYKNIDLLLEKCDAIYIVSNPKYHYEDIKKSINKGKHVLCEAPICLKVSEYQELLDLAKKKSVIVMEAIKTAYSMAYYRLLLLVKSGYIGDVVSIDATCTSLRDFGKISNNQYKEVWNSISAWGPTALLPIFQILGNDYIGMDIFSIYKDRKEKFDLFTKISFVYKNSVASIKVGKGVKSEGELIISGTEGYIYVPAPWWKMDYFEVRYENKDPKRFYYQLDGEGIRYELVEFVKCILNNKKTNYINDLETLSIIKVIEEYYKK